MIASQYLAFGVELLSVLPCPLFLLLALSLLLLSPAATDGSESGGSLAVWSVPTSGHLVRVRLRAQEGVRAPVWPRLIADPQRDARDREGAGPPSDVLLALRREHLPLPRSLFARAHARRERPARTSPSGVRGTAGGPGGSEAPGVRPARRSRGA